MKFTATPHGVNCEVVAAASFPGLGEALLIAGLIANDISSGSDDEVATRVAAPPAVHISPKLSAIKYL